MKKAMTAVTTGSRALAAPAHRRGDDYARRYPSGAGSTSSPTLMPALLLGVRLAVGGGRDGAADHAGDGNQRQHVRQDVEERRRRAEYTCSRNAIALENPNRRAAPNAPAGASCRRSSPRAR